MNPTLYFSHDYDARNNLKMKRACLKHGIVAFGTYFVLLEVMRGREDYQIDESYLEVLHHDAYQSPEDFKSVFTTLVEVGLIRHENGKIFSPGLLERMQLMDEKRLKYQQSAKSRWSNSERRISNAHATHKQRTCDAMQIKEIKRKESKAKENIIPFTEILELYNSLCPNLTHHKVLSAQAKKLIAARWATYPNLEQWKGVFRNANQNTWAKETRQGIIHVVGPDMFDRYLPSPNLTAVNMKDIIKDCFAGNKFKMPGESPS